MIKTTHPSVPGGLMNKSFVYVNRVNTDIAKTFARVRQMQHQAREALPPPGNVPMLCLGLRKTGDGQTP